MEGTGHGARAGMKIERLRGPRVARTIAYARLAAGQTNLIALKLVQCAPQRLRES